MAWKITYTYRGAHGLFHTRDRDEAIEKARQLASEGKTRIAVHGPDGKIPGDSLCRQRAVCPRDVQNSSAGSE